MFTSIIIIPIMILSSLSPIMLSNLLLIWFIMEISNFMFIMYMMFNTKQKKMIFMYFIIQIMASFMLLCSFIINPMSFCMITQTMIFTALFLKTGIPPFHLWMPLISKFMTWMTIFFMLTMQKISPLIMFYLMMMNKWVFTIIIIMTLIVPPAIMINLKSIKMLIVYSSINQTGWIIALIFLKNLLWLLYFMVYSSILLMITSILTYSEISYKLFQYSFKKFNLMFTIMMMNLASMPPFTFFMFKWFSTFTLVLMSNLKMTIVIMLINSLLMTFIYIKMMLWSLFTNKFEPKIIHSKLYAPKFKNVMLSILSIMLPLMMMI